jgi:hypothetical protein
MVPQEGRDRRCLPFIHRKGGVNVGVFGNKEAETVVIAGRQLHCTICDHARFWQRRAQLNTAVATFFHFDWLNASAMCIVCEKCGYIHWFLPPE